MTYVRRTIKPVAILWLVCHLWIGVLVSGVEHAHGSVEAADVACHCQHADGHECPMHKTTRGRSRCAMRSADDMRGVADVASLLGPLGLLPCDVQALRPDALTSSLLITRFNVVGRPTPPALPPPRA
jgi:hypothetical protein